MTFAGGAFVYFECTSPEFVFSFVFVIRVRNLIKISYFLVLLSTL